ncbi:MAG: S-layer protein [Candidatus Aenigmarchaeota archaeon]|nr:S-layer protein [Candidatus Aenigmarchaeota archaeon]
MFEITSASSLGTSDASLTLRDVFSGSTLEVKLGATNQTTKVIDGQSYYFDASGAVSTTDLNLKVTWGNGASLGAAGDFRTVFPTLLTKNRARLALTNPVTMTGITVGKSVQLPTGAINFTTVGNASNVVITPVTTERSDSTVLVNAAGSSVGSLQIGNGAGVGILNSTVFGLGKTTGGIRWYSIDTSATNGTLTVRAAKGKSNAVAGQTNSTTPGVLLVEEQDDNSDVNSVLVDIGQDTSSGDNRTNSNAADFSSASQGTGTLTRDSNTDISFNTDFWGTVSWRDTGDQDKVTLWYPDDQVSAQVYVLAEGATIGGTSSTGGTTVDKWTVNPIKTALAKLDSEVTSADKATKHLILVGGPCVNTLVADLNTAGKFPYSCKSWPARNFGLLQVVDDAFASGKVALVVAGTRAEDTRWVTSKLQMYDTAGLSGTSKEFTA